MNILLVGSRAYFCLYAIQCLHAPNIHIHILGSGDYFPARFSRHCAGYFHCSQEAMTGDNALLIQKINTYIAEHDIDIIIPCGMMAAMFVSAIQEKLIQAKIFPVAETKILEELNNKWFFAELLRQMSLPHPATVLIESLSDIENLGLRFPLIIKPLAMYGGLGVKKIDSVFEVRHYLTQKYPYNALPLIAQEYIEGYDVGLNMLALDGKLLAWTVQQSLPDGSIEFIEDPIALSLGERLIAHVNYSGIMHIDLFFDTQKQELNILECNPRIWGSILASKFEGVNFLSLGLNIARQQPIDLQKIIRKIRFLSMRKFFDIFRRNGIKDAFLHNFYSDFWEMFSDPLPYFFLLISEIRRKPHELA